MSQKNKAETKPGHVFAYEYDENFNQAFANKTGGEDYSDKKEFTDEQMALRRLQMKQNDFVKKVQKNTTKNAAAMLVKTTAANGDSIMFDPNDIKEDDDVYTTFQKMVQVSYHKLRTSGGNKYKYEGLFLKLYEYMTTHQDEIFPILAQRNQREYQETVVPVLGVYCTIFRQRLEIPACKRILNGVYGRAIFCYEKSVMDEKPPDLDSIFNLRGLIYKYYMIMYNAELSLPAGYENDDIMHKSFTECCRYEMQTKMDFDSQQFSFLMNMLGFKPSLKNVDRIQKKHMKVLVSLATRPSKGNAASERKRCANCTAEEKVLNEFRKCKTCKGPYYCCVACQKSDWDVHKKACGVLKTLMEEKKMDPLVCSQCKKPETTTKKYKKCGACVVAVYCKAACQKKDWPEHKLVCKFAKKLKERADWVETNRKTTEALVN